MKTEQVLGDQLRPGDTLVIQGYLWVVDRVQYDENNLVRRYVATCHWSGQGVNPRFFNNDFTSGLRVDLPWTRVIAEAK